MLNFLFFVKFISFPERKDSILTKISSSSQHLSVESSGALGLYHHGSCHKTYPNQTVVNDEMQEWCSNIAPSGEAKDSPWILYFVKNKAFQLSGYSVRNGCCRYICCVDDHTDIDYCCCDLYSFSLLGSNDNITWKVIHKVEKDSQFFHCQFKTYEFKTKTEPFRILKFALDKEYPGCPKCMQINQIDFYGDLVTDHFSFDEEYDQDETISIIGKIKNN